MNAPEHGKSLSDASHSNLTPKTSDLTEVPEESFNALVPPGQVICVEKLQDEIASLTLNNLIESISHARNILTSHRLSGMCNLPPVPSGERKTLPPPPVEQRGGLVIVRPSPDRTLLLLGDIHGDTESLLTILSQSRALERIASGEDFFIVGLGDYINKGPHSLEALYILARLLIDPVLQGRVIVLRGNHEDKDGSKSKEEPRLRKKFFTAVEKNPLFKNKQSRAISKFTEEAAQFFDELPHTLYSPCGLLGSHSGYSQWIIDHNRKKVWEALAQWPPHQQIMKELLDSSITQIIPSKDGKKSEYHSPADTYRFMEKLEVSLLLRGHQSAAPRALDPNETWKMGYWYLNQTSPTAKRGIITLNSSKFCGTAHPAYCEISLTKGHIGLEDCTLYTLTDRK